MDDDRVVPVVRGSRGDRGGRFARKAGVPAVVGAAGVFALGLAGPPAAGAQSEESAREAAPPQQQIDSYFNEPGDDEIVQELKSLIDDAAPRSEIQAAQFRLWDEPVTSALIEAATERDVRVQIIVDQGTRNEEKDTHFEDLEVALEEDGDDNTWVKVCDDSEDDDADAGGCNGTNVMHNKFFLFSETRQQTNMVANSSANLSEDTVGGTGGWNDLYTISGNDELFLSFYQYFGDLSSVADWYKDPDSDHKEPNPDYYAANPPKVHGNTKHYFYPRTEGSGNDTYLNSLNQVDCAEPTNIRVNMFSITRRGIAERLHEMADEGCSVDIVATRLSDEACSLLTGGGTVPQAMSIRGFGHEEQEEGTHQKSLMIQGSYAGEDTKVVFAGSHNWNYRSWTYNDESVIRVKDDLFHRTFIENHAAVKDDATVEIDSVSDCGAIGPEDGNAEAEAV